jgi:hypothetical protein
MKKQILILKKGLNIALLSLPFIYSVQSNAQLYAAADFNFENSKSYTSYSSGSTKLELDGPWFSYSETGKLEKVEIYKNGIIVESRFGKDAEALLVQNKVEELNLRLNSDRVIIESLYANLGEYNAGKKVILDNYKIVLLDLQMQLNESGDLILFNHLSEEIKEINRNMLDFYISDSYVLEKKLIHLTDADQIKKLLLVK